MALGVGRGTAERSTSAMTSYWIIGLPATPVSCTLVCPHADTRGCPRPWSAVLGGPSLAGPFASDGAARFLAKMGLVRLPSVSESSSIYGSRILKMTKLAKRDSLLVCRFGGGDVLGTGVSLSVPTARVGAGTTGDGEGMIASSSSSMGWSYLVSLSVEMMALSYPLSACCA